MKLLYTHENRFWLANVRNLFEREGLATEVKNQFVGGAAGEVPHQDVWPELWLLDESQFERAKQLLEEILAAQEREGPAWHCSACGEENGSQFELCWACSELRPQ
ncbi:MAG: DUF2007 domain-containing protein [Cellvibrionaceae bacterium]|nr:DUF2007 domain-containing protein [Cellvibrionaceae bacterium]